MKEYHKIQTVYMRDPDNKYKTLLEGEYSIPQFEYLKNNPWVFTEKVDGTNIRVIINKGNITFGGKTDNAQIPTELTNWLINKFKELEKIEGFSSRFDGAEEVCLYGEGYGNKIQKAGKLYGDTQKFVLFDVKVGNFWLSRENVEDVAFKLDLDVVPVVGTGTLDDMVKLCKHGHNGNISFNSRWGDFQPEGIVARPETELCTHDGKRIITKLKCKDFRKE